MSAGGALVLRLFHRASYDTIIHEYSFLINVELFTFRNSRIAGLDKHQELSPFYV